MNVNICLSKHSKLHNIYVVRSHTQRERERERGERERREEREIVCVRDRKRREREERENICSPIKERVEKYRLLLKYICQI